MKFTRILIITIILSTFSQCKKKEVNLVEEDPSLPPTIEAFTEPIESELVVEFYDARTGRAIETPITVDISGKDKAVTTNHNGNVINSFVSERGMVSFSTSKKISATNPFDATVIAHLDGYVSTSKRFRTHNTGISSMKINMVKASDTPEGVSAVTNSRISTSTGVTASEVVIEASATSSVTSTTTKTTVSVPQGVEMKDKSGKVLKGEVKSTLVYFGTQDDPSLNSFPGGFEAIVDNNNSDQDGVFTTAGFVSLEMTVNGTKVSDFSKPISITTEVPAATINPETGNRIQTGEKIDVWSYDTETGEWKYEATAVFGAQLPNGNFEAKMTANHLSYWNLDWFTRDGTCPNRLPVKFDVPEMTGKEYIEFEIINKTTGRLYKTKKVLVENGATAYFYRLPKNIDFTFKASENSDYSGTLEVSACTSGELTYNLTRRETTNPTITITADIAGYCPQNPEVLIKVSQAFMYRKVGSNTWKTTDMVEGLVTLPNLEVGEKYEAQFEYNDTWHYRTAEVESGKTFYELVGEVSEEDCQ